MSNIKLDQKHLTQTVDFMKRFLGVTNLHYSQYHMLDIYIQKKEKEAVKQKGR